MTTPPLKPLPMSRVFDMPSIGRYNMGKVLGKGNFGAVRVGASPSGTQYAVKKMSVGNKQRLMKERAIWEVRILQAVHCHPFVIEYKEATYASGAVYIVMELAAGGNLRQLIHKYKSHSGALPESMVRKYFLQLALALKALHDASILHRDLKSDNVFLDENMDVKLGDFGLARTIESGSYAYTPAGTPGYQAPEIAMGRAYNTKADVWAMGCIVYEMCAGRVPYHPSMKNQMMYMQAPSLPYTYSSGLRKLIEKTLSKNAHSRPSINAVLADPYLRAALDEDLTPEQRALFDSSGALLSAQVGVPDDSAAAHADEIQRALIGSIPVRAMDFKNVDTKENPGPSAKSNSKVKAYAATTAAPSPPLTSSSDDGSGFDPHDLVDTSTTYSNAHPHPNNNTTVNDSVALFGGIDNLLGDLDLDHTLDPETIARKIKEMNSRFTKISKKKAKSKAKAKAKPTTKAAKPARPARASSASSSAASSSGSGPAVPPRSSARARKSANVPDRKTPTVLHPTKSAKSRSKTSSTTTTVSAVPSSSSSSSSSTTTTTILSSTPISSSTPWATSTPYGAGAFGMYSGGYAGAGYFY